MRLRNMVIILSLAGFTSGLQAANCQSPNTTHNFNITTNNQMLHNHFTLSAVSYYPPRDAGPIIWTSQPTTAFAAGQSQTATVAICCDSQNNTTGQIAINFDVLSNAGSAVESCLLEMDVDCSTNTVLSLPKRKFCTSIHNKLSVSAKTKNTNDWQITIHD